MRNYLSLVLATQQAAASFEAAAFGWVQYYLDAKAVDDVGTIYGLKPAPQSSSYREKELGYGVFKECDPAKIWRKVIQGNEWPGKSGWETGFDGSDALDDTGKRLDGGAEWSPHQIVLGVQLLCNLEVNECPLQEIAMSKEYIEDLEEKLTNYGVNLATATTNSQIKDVCNSLTDGDDTEKLQKKCNKRRKALKDEKNHFDDLVTRRYSNELVDPTTGEPRYKKYLLREDDMKDRSAIIHGVTFPNVSANDPDDPAAMKPNPRNTTRVPLDAARIWGLVRRASYESMLIEHSMKTAAPAWATMTHVNKCHYSGEQGFAKCPQQGFAPCHSCGLNPFNPVNNQLPDFIGTLLLFIQKQPRHKKRCVVEGNPEVFRARIEKDDFLDDAVLDTDEESEAIDWYNYA